MELVNSQLAFLKVEIKEEANTYARGAAMIALALPSRLSALPC